MLRCYKCFIYNIPHIGDIRFYFRCLMQNFQNYINSLKQKQYATIVHSTEYKNLLSDMCSRIISKAKIAPNEATIENYFDCELFSFFREVFSPLGFEYQPVKEGRRCAGRKDS